MSRKNINELEIGETIDETFILKSYTVKLTRTNKQYLDVTLQDKTGTISGKMWDMPPEGMNVFEEGGFVKAMFLVSSYNDLLQADVKQLVPLNSESITVEEKAELVPCIEERPADLMKQLSVIINNLQTKEYKDLALDMIGQCKKAYAFCPAAKSAHHAEIGGLLQHSLEVVKYVEAIYSVTPWFDKELCIIAAGLYYFGKIQ